MPSIYHTTPVHATMENPAITPTEKDDPTSITFLLPPSDKERVRACAERKHMKMSTFCRITIMGAVEKDEASNV